MERHIHARSYAALVLSGGYEEAGDSGRFNVRAGHVVLHEQFEAHLDRFTASGAVVLNIPLPEGVIFRTGLGRVADPDRIAHAAEKDVAEAAARILALVEMAPQQPKDWPDELAADLARNSALNLTNWGNARGIAPWTLSRGFSRIFGISPSSYRACARARRGWNAVRTTREPLAAIAARLGFADQAHMTRAIRHLTGEPPQAWRIGANGFKTR